MTQSSAPLSSPEPASAEQPIPAVAPVSGVGTMDGPRKARVWVWLVRIVCILSGLAIGVQSGLMMLREGSAHVPFILFQALCAMALVVAVFVFIARMLSTGPDGAASPAHPWLLQVIAQDERPSILVDVRGLILFANAPYEALSHNLTGGAVVTPVYLAPTQSDYAASTYRLSEAVRKDQAAGRALSETVQFSASPSGAGHLGKMRLTVQPIAGGDGRVQAVLWQFSPVTETVIAKPAVSFDSLQQATAVLDHAPVGYLSVASDGQVLQINATLAHWLNWDLALFLSGERHIQDILLSDTSTLLAMMAPGTPAFASTTQHFEGLLKRADGGRMPVELIHLVETDAQGLALPSCTIVVPRKMGLSTAQAERDLMGQAVALPDEELAFSVPDHAMVMFNHAPIGVAVLNQNGEIVSSNQRFDQIFSLVDRSKPGRADKLLAIAGLVPADQQGAVAYAWHQVSHKAMVLPPLNIALGDGERSVSLHLSRAFGGGNEAGYLFAVETTEQRNLEAQFAQAQKMQAVGELAGGIAHDFNNVLQGILGFTDLLLVSHRPTDPSFHDLMQIKSNATRAAGLVRHLLAFSRRQTLRPRLVSLNDAVTDATLLLRRLLGETIPLDIKLGRDLWPVMTDPSQFDQAVINLALNSRDAMPDGGRLVIRTRNVTAADCATLIGEGAVDADVPLADYVVIEIEDSGTGIPLPMMSKIFQPFFTTKEVGKGTGLGLSMVYGFVKQSGGFILCRSEMGKGTCFTILLPRLDEKQLAQIESEQPAQQPSEQADLTGAGLILLVEDEDAVRAFAARALSQRGYSVLEAASGAEALDVFAAHPEIDLIVSDVVMPEMDGPTMLRELRKQGAAVKIIFVSGYAEEAFAKNLPDGEDFGFLPKPFSLKQLIEAVKTTLAGRA